MRVNAAIEEYLREPPNKKALTLQAKGLGFALMVLTNKVLTIDIYFEKESPLPLNLQAAVGKLTIPLFVDNLQIMQRQFICWHLLIEEATVDHPVIRNIMSVFNVPGCKVGYANMKVEFEVKAWL